MVGIGTLSICIVTTWIRALIQWYSFGITKRRLISWITVSKNSIVLVYLIARGLILSSRPSYLKPASSAVSIGDRG
jgi:hypothetical protein